MHNVLLILKLNVKKNLQSLREIIDRQEWIGYSPTIVNAFYNPSFNDICKKMQSSERKQYILLAYNTFSISSWHSSNAFLPQRCAEVYNCVD